MAYIPPKSKRQYQRAIWSATDGELIAHDCAKCRKSNDGKAQGTWFERADQPDVWCWVCEECKPNAGIERR